MDFKELNYVVTLAKYQSYTTAANVLFITQPALTKAIKRLENEYGESLFTRNKNLTIPTEFGEKFVQYAERLLAMKKEMDHDLEFFQQKNVPSFNIGITPVSGRFLQAKTALPFQQLHPHVRLSFFDALTCHLYDMAENGDVDIALCINPEYPFYKPRPNLKSIILYKAEVLLAVRSDSPLVSMAVRKPEFKYPWISLNLAKKERFLLQPEDQFTTIAARYLFQQQNFHPTEINNITNIHSAMDLACAGYGIAIVNEGHLAILEQKQKLVPLSTGEEPLFYNSAALFNKNLVLPDYAYDYIRLVTEIYHRTLPNLWDQDPIIFQER